MSCSLDLDLSSLFSTHSKHSVVVVVPFFRVRLCSRVASLAQILRFSFVRSVVWSRNAINNIIPAIIFIVTSFLIFVSSGTAAAAAILFIFFFFFFGILLHNSQQYRIPHAMHERIIAFCFYAKTLLFFTYRHLFFWSHATRSFSLEMKIKSDD